MNRRNFVLAAAALPALGACFKSYPADFSIEWDEEVRLHDDRMIVVHVKRKFWRRHERVEWDALYMGTEIAFDRGAPGGWFKRDFNGYDIPMIEQKGSSWYLSLIKTGGGPGPRPPLVSELYPVLIVTAEGTEVPARSWADVPYFPRFNMLPLVGSLETFAGFNGRRLAWDEKIEFWKTQGRESGRSPERELHRFPEQTL